VRIALDCGKGCRDGDGEAEAVAAEEIIGKLREAEVGLAQGQTIGQVVRKLGVSEQTYYRWRREYGGLEVDQAKRLKELERENARERQQDVALTGCSPIVTVFREASTPPRYEAPSVLRPQFNSEASWDRGGLESPRCGTRFSTADRSGGSPPDEQRLHGQQLLKQTRKAERRAAGESQPDVTLLSADQLPVVWLARPSSREPAVPRGTHAEAHDDHIAPRRACASLYRSAARDVTSTRAPSVRVWTVVGGSFSSRVAPLR